jgi:pyruvate/2-oxoglutarate dehydrogenase complex dihydrolipoamide acyltransferase (E2) component
MQQMSLLPVPDDWESNDAELKLGGGLGMHPDVLSQFNLGDRIEITVVAVIDGAGFKEKEVQGLEIKTITRSSKLEAGGRIRRAAKDTSVFKDVPEPGTIDAMLSNQSAVDALADAALGATGDGIDSVEVVTGTGTRAKRTRAPKADKAAGGQAAAPAAAEPPAAAPPAAPAAEGQGENAEALTDLQLGALRVLAAEPGCDLDQFQKSLSGINGSSYDATEAKAIVDLLIRRGLAVLTEHNDYELSASGEAAIVA